MGRCRGTKVAIVCLLAAACGGASSDTTAQHRGAAGVPAMCNPPSEAAVDTLTPHQVDALTGQYELTVIGTQGMKRDTLVRGTLHLWMADSAHHLGHAADGRVMPLAGASDIDLRLLAPVSLAHSPASRDRDRPGVQMWSDGTMWFGNSFNGKAITTDAGVIFDRIQLTSRGFSGRWVEGGRSVINGALPAGYFCAARIDG